MEPEAGERRIAFYLPSLAGGGAERSMVNLANVIAGLGFPVDMVLGRADGPFLPALAAAVRVVDLKSTRVWQSIPGLVTYMRTMRPRVLLAALTHANVAALIARGLAGSRARVVVTEHSPLTGAGWSDLNWRGKMVAMAARCFYPRAHMVVAVSEGVADDLARLLPFPRRDIRVIYNPVLFPELSARAAQAPGHPWFEPGEPPVVLACGRLTEAKDYPTLLRAFAVVRAAIPSRLLILGEGEKRPELLALARQLGVDQDFALPGFTANPYTYMSRAGVFALSSAWEGLGNVLVEAMACGSPVVATDCPSGPREILGAGRYGRLVPVGDHVALAEAILSSLREPRPVYPPEALERFTGEYAARAYLAVM